MADSGTKIQLIEYQKPALEAGNYEVVADQDFKPTANDGSQRYKGRSRFTVSGPRFSLDPGVVRAVFPPQGAVGQYSPRFPHVSLRSPTLPWERSAYGADDYEPWLALLVIDDADVERGDVEIPNEPRPLGELAELQGFKYRYQADAVDTDKTEQVMYLKVKQKLLHHLMPQGRSLKLQAHVRRRQEPDGTGREFAIVFADRLPRAGAGSRCFLVSVEGLYNDDANKTFAYGDANSNEFIVLASLVSWGFASLPHDGKTFEQLVEDIDTGPLVVPAPNANAAAGRHVAVGEAPLWHELRSTDQTYSWYRGPLSPVRTEDGAVLPSESELPVFADGLLNYHNGEGMFDVSEAAAFELGKALAVNDRAFTAALFDWKDAFNHRVLRRLEAASAAQVLLGAADQAATPEQDFAGETAASPSAGDTTATGDSLTDERLDYLRTWFGELALLKQVPFNYLVPDEAMLPPESLRFFDLDRAWVDALLCGAFAVGGALRTDRATIDITAQLLDSLAVGETPIPLQTRLALALEVPPGDAGGVTMTYDSGAGIGQVTVGATGTSYPVRRRGTTLVVRDPAVRRRAFKTVTGRPGDRAFSGVLVRSQLVSGWPDMFIEAFPRTVVGGRRRPDSLSPMANVRAERLAPDTLLLLFVGRMRMIEFFLKPEGLQFGLDENVAADGSTTLSKTVDNGDEKPVRWRSADHRLVDLAKLAADIKPRLTAAGFGMELFEGSAKGRFTIGSQT